MNPKDSSIFLTSRSVGDYYNYVSYTSKSGKEREALFMFSNREAQGDFIRAFARWKKQESQPIPNYR